MSLFPGIENLNPELATLLPSSYSRVPDKRPETIINLSEIFLPGRPY